MDEATPIIKIEGLTKTFRDFWRRPTARAVAGIDLAVSPGEVFGLLGPNGSGKSTTIKLLLGLLHPTAGTIRILGANPRDIAVKRHIGYLPEVTCLHKFLTPAETLHYYAGLFGLDCATTRARTRELLRMVDLEHVAHRPVGEFSKGMARRVGLAQALINNPQLIILDEPTSGLDPIACREVKDWVRQMAAAGKTVFLTSHLLADVEDICDRIAILCRGTLRAEGRVAELLQRPDAARLTLEGLSEGEVGEIRDELSRRLGCSVPLDHPRISLETFFLQVVAGAGCGSDGGEDGVAARRPAPAPFLVRESAPSPEGDRR